MTIKTSKDFEFMFVCFFFFLGITKKMKINFLNKLSV